MKFLFFGIEVDYMDKFDLVQYKKWCNDRDNFFSLLIGIKDAKMTFDEIDEDPYVCWVERMKRCIQDLFEADDSEKFKNSKIIFCDWIIADEQELVKKYKKYYSMKNVVVHKRNELRWLLNHIVFLSKDILEELKKKPDQSIIYDCKFKELAKIPFWLPGIGDVSGMFLLEFYLEYVYEDKENQFASIPYYCARDVFDFRNAPLTVYETGYDYDDDYHLVNTNNQNGKFLHKKECTERRSRQRRHYHTLRRQIQQRWDKKDTSTNTLLSRWIGDLLSDRISVEDIESQKKCFWNEIGKPTFQDRKDKIKEENKELERLKARKKRLKEKKENYSNIEIEIMECSRNIEYDKKMDVAQYIEPELWTRHMSRLDKRLKDGYTLIDLIEYVQYEFFSTNENLNVAQFDYYAEWDTMQIHDSKTKYNPDPDLSSLLAKPQRALFENPINYPGFFEHKKKHITDTGIFSEPEKKHNQAMLFFRSEIKRHCLKKFIRYFQFYRDLLLYLIRMETDGCSYLNIINFPIMVKKYDNGLEEQLVEYFTKYYEKLAEKNIVCKKMPHDMVNNTLFEVVAIELIKEKELFFIRQVPQHMKDDRIQVVESDEKQRQVIFFICQQADLQCYFYGYSKKYYGALPALPVKNIDGTLKTIINIYQYIDKDYCQEANFQRWLNKWLKKYIDVFPVLQNTDIAKVLKTAMNVCKDIDKYHLYYRQIDWEHPNFMGCMIFISIMQAIINKENTGMFKQYYQNERGKQPRKTSVLIKKIAKIDVHEYAFLNRLLYYQIQENMGDRVSCQKWRDCINVSRQILIHRIDALDSQHFFTGIQHVKSIFDKIQYDIFDEYNTQ